MRRAVIGCGVLAVSALGPMSIAMSASQVGGIAARRDARIAGRVLVCNTPETCLTRHFKVVTRNAAGRTVARTSTRGAHNHFALRVSPGSYRLVATSSGLVCKTGATATAHHTTHTNITCFVP